MLVVAIMIAIMCATAGAAAAQWLSLPLAGTPRTADGKANLGAPAPRAADGKPDLSGIWKVDSPRYNSNLLAEGNEAPMLPWAAALYKMRLATLGADRPGLYCMPHGVPDAMTVPNLPFKIAQMPGLTIVLYEEFHKFRQIHTDGRPLPVDPDPAWYGYSIGRWDGDTFVVDTAGFREGSWLDNNGHPHTEALRVTERFRRLNFGRLELDVTIDDRKTVMKLTIAGVICLAVLPASGRALAHHSFAADFDANKPVTLSGTVTKIEWANPHTWFFVDVKDADGKVTNWGLELAGPAQLVRNGWKRDSLKIGDAVTVDARRARDGTSNANAISVVLTASGQRLFGASSQGQ